MTAEAPNLCTVTHHWSSRLFPQFGMYRSRHV